MSVVSEAQTAREVVLDVQDSRDVAVYVDRISTQLPVLARLPLRQAKQRWNSTLNERDLQCLLQIIEVDVVPQLLKSYSPARCAPDDRLA